MSAGGHYLPPMLIYPYKRIPGRNLLEGFPDAVLQISDNGWITSAIFHAWLRDIFIPQTMQVEKPLVLFVDGHASHKSLIETSQLCEDHGVILYCLPPHASHLVQPLDQAFFGSIKPAWADAARRYVVETGEAVGLDSFAKVLQPVWREAATDQNATQSFKAAGIYPFNPDRVLQSGKMGPCVVYREDATAALLSPEPPSSFSEGLSDIAGGPTVTAEASTVTAEAPTVTAEAPPVTSEGPVVLPDGPSDVAERPTDAIEGPSAMSEKPFDQPLELPLPLPPLDQQGPSGKPENPFGLHSELPLPLPPLPFDQSPELLPPSSPLDQPGPSAMPEEPPLPLPLTPLDQQAEAPSLLPTPLPTSSETEEELDSKQLESLKDLLLFCYDELGRNDFLKYFQCLAKGVDHPTDEKYQTFKNHTITLRQAFKKNKKVAERGHLTIDDILQVPNHSG